MKTNEPLSEKDIHVDKKHPSEEALNFNIISIKQYLDQKAWEKVVNSCMLLYKQILIALFSNGQPLQV